MQIFAGRLVDVDRYSIARGHHAANRLKSKAPFSSNYSLSAELRRRLTMSCASEQQGSEVTTIRARPAGPAAKGDPERSRFSGADESQGLRPNDSGASVAATVWDLAGAISRGDWRQAMSIVDSLDSVGDECTAEELSNFIAGMPQIQ
jgi:hypothetical protein